MKKPELLSSSAMIKVGVFITWALLFLFILYIPAFSKKVAAERALNVITFSDIISPKIAEEFEQKTGIKIHFSYFDNNEELLLKLKTTRAEGYDLMLVSDYIIQQLVEDDLLAPIDRKKIYFWSGLNPQLLGKYFDPENRYSIPYSWIIYGLGIDTEYFKPLPFPSWDLIFKKHDPFFTIGMLDNPRENVLLAAYYLFGTIDNLSKQQLDAVEKLLIEQKQWIESYTEYRADYLLLSKAVPVVVIPSPHFLRLRKTVEHVEFIIPEQGTFMVIDSFVLPKHAQQDFVYQFLNFLYQPDIIAYHADVNPFLPATTQIEKLLKEADPSGSVYDAHINEHKFEYFRDTVPNKVLNKIWINLKAA